MIMEKVSFSEKKDEKNAEAGFFQKRVTPVEYLWRILCLNMDSLEISPDFLQHLTQYQLAIRGYIRGSIANQFDADDVFQKTNIILCRKADEWNREIPFLKWAFAVARYEVMGHYRDQSREKLVFNETVMELVMKDCEEVAPTVSQRAKQLKGCLAELSDENRFILRARYGTDQNLEQISKQVGRSVNGVKSLLKRLRKKIDGCINEKMEAQS